MGPAPANHEVRLRNGLGNSSKDLEKEIWGPGRSDCENVRPPISAHFMQPPGQPGRLTSHSQETIPVLAIHCQTVKSLPKNNRCFTFYA